MYVVYITTLRLMYAKCKYSDKYCTNDQAGTLRLTLLVLLLLLQYYKKMNKTANFPKDLRLFQVNVTFAKFSFSKDFCKKTSVNYVLFVRFGASFI